MNFLQRLFGHTPTAAAPEEKRANPYASPVPLRTYSGWGDSLARVPNRTGVLVDESSALGVSAIICALNVISGDIGSLPLNLYESGDQGGKGLATTHPLARILNVSPNPECTAPVFWESFVFHCLLNGGGYAEIQREESGRAVALWLIHPKNIKAARRADGSLYYVVNGGTGTKELEPEFVFHVPGLAPDTIQGLRILEVCRDAIGFTIATDAYGQAYFANAGNVQTVIEHPSTFSETAVENLRQSFKKDNTGIDNTGSTLILEEGTKHKRETLSNEAAQYDETRRYQVSEVARLFNISPVKLHELGRATWGNLSTLNSDYWDNTCRKWANKIEAEIARKLLLPSEQGKYFAEFDPDLLTRGDRTTRYANYEVGIRAGFLEVKTVCQWENLPVPKPKPVPVPQLPPDQGDTTKQGGKANG